MKQLFSIFLILLLPLYALKGQDEETVKSKNAIYLEALGNGVMYSINYERLFRAKNSISPFVRIGGNMLPVEAADSSRIYIISEAGLIIGKKKNFFDASLGYTRSLYKPDMDNFIIFRAGFRYSGPRGLLFRFSPMYVYNTQKGDVFGNVFWLGASLGYAF